MKKTPPTRVREKRVKAWCIIDISEDGRLERSGDTLMIDRTKTLRKHLHKDYESIPCTITYKLPTKVQRKRGKGTV